MELKLYLQILKKNLALLLAFSLAGLAIAYFSAPKLTSPYSQSQLFYLTASQEEQTGTYSFQGYFAQEKARNFTDSAVAILTSPDFSDQLKAEGQGLEARKVAPQVIRLTASAQSQDQADSLIKEAVDHFNQKMVTLSPDPIQMKAIGQNSQAVEGKIDQRVLSIFGILIGFTFAVLVISLKTYFRI